MQNVGTSKYTCAIRRRYLSVGILRRISPEKRLLFGPDALASLKNEQEQAQSSPHAVSRPAPRSVRMKERELYSIKEARYLMAASPARASISS